MRLFHLLWLFILWLKMEKSSQRDAIKCTVPVIENGNVPGDTQEYNEHEVLHFECNPNYIPTDHRPTTCTKQRGRAEWIPTPYCETTKCRLTLPPLEGTIYEPAYRNVFKPGDTVRVICGERYGISNAQNTSATVTCNDDGDWTVRPLCKEVTCSVRRDPLVDNWNVQRLTLNGTARYTCRSGYRSKDGTNLATCTRDGWRPKPLCQEITCEREDIPNANILSSKWRYKNNERANYECKEGYEARPTRICGENGWTGNSQCTVALCQVTGVPDSVHITPSVPNKQLRRGQQLRFACRHHGHFLQGKAMVECLADGQWSAPFPTCGGPLGCNNPPSLTDGDTRESLRGRYSHNERVEYVCQNLYQMEGEPYQTCRNGEWLGRMRCLNVTCQVPGMHSHLSVVGLSPANKTVRSGHTIRFQCKSPHTLDGSEAIECLQSGEWSAPFPTCAEKCQVTGVPNSVHITPSVPNKQLRRGQQLRFACRHHGHFLQGKAMVECLADGQWSAPFPTCGGPLGCNNPPTLTDGDTMESLRGHYSHNERVEYVCQNLYQMEGEPYQTCRNGEWLGRMRCLRPCTVDTEAMSRHNIAFRFRGDNKLYLPHNDHITFTCVRGRHDGRLNMRQSCIDGVMHLPTCH